MNVNFKIMNNERIIVMLHALNWTMGEVAFFDITLSGDGELDVSWGDGRVSCHRPRYKGENIRVEHDYGKNAKIYEQHFVINIECKDATIRTLHTGCFDMEIDDIDFSDSPSIESLNMSWLGDIDLSPITALKHLDCTGSLAPMLDFRHNTELETLICRCSRARKLLLSRCDKLKELDCSCSSDLQEIALSNNSELTKIIISSDHNIKPKSWEYVQKIIEKNHGEIIFE